jgi:positive regulator of sigma E activity
MNKEIKRGIFIPAVAIMLMTLNFTRLKDSECIRAIHVVTLLVMGFALGVLVMNLITLYKNSKQQ